MKAGSIRPRQEGIIDKYFLIISFPVFCFSFKDRWVVEYCGLRGLG